jgi:hypothetical protein
MTLIPNFIAEERERFENEDNNKFMVAFSQISRYSEFLSIILKRYENVSEQFLQNTKALQALSLPGSHKMTEQQMSLYNEGAQLGSVLHLEIESFYLFAKILLDKIAHALEFYFGQARRKSLDSHDNLVKNFVAYAEGKGLTLPADLMPLAQELKKDISDYRDYEIAHEKSPRRLSGTVFDTEGRTRIAAMALYPTDKDQQVESKALHDLDKVLNRYREVVINFVKDNKAKTRLKIASEGTLPTV